MNNTKHKNILSTNPLSTVKALLRITLFSMALVCLPTVKAFGVDLTLQATNDSLTSSLAEHLPGGTTGGVTDIEYQEILIYNKSGYTIDNLKLTTTCLTNGYVEEKQAEIDEHMANQPGNDESDEVKQTWVEELQVLHAEVIELVRSIPAFRESAKITTNIHNLVVDHGDALFTTLLSATDEDGYEWVCSSDLEIDAVWGEKESFDMDRSAGCTVDAKGTTLNVKANVSCDL